MLAGLVVILLWGTMLIVISDGDGGNSPGASSVAEAFRATPATLAVAAAMLIAGLGAVGWLWWNRGRDHVFSRLHYLYPSAFARRRTLRHTDDIVIEYLPPDGILPAQAAVLLFEDIGTRDIVGTIVDLAARRYIALESSEGGWRFSGLDREDDLEPFERLILDRLLRGEEDSLVADTTGTDFIDHRRARRAVFEDAVSRGWIEEDPDTQRGRWSTWALLLFLCGPPVGLILGSLWGYGYVGVATIVVACALQAVSRLMPVRTALGSEMRRRVLGFKKYVDEAEGARLKFGERERVIAEYAGYAVVFGTTRAWAAGMRAIAGLDMGTLTVRREPRTAGEMLMDVFGIGGLLPPS